MASFRWLPYHIEILHYFQDQSVQNDETQASQSSSDTQIYCTCLANSDDLLCTHQDFLPVWILILAILCGKSIHVMYFSQAI